MTGKRQRRGKLPTRVPLDFEEKRVFLSDLRASITPEEIDACRRKEEEFPDAPPPS